MSVRGMNKQIVCGNLGADPELHDGGKVPVCTISIAAPGRIKDGNQEVEWVKTVLFGKTAENAKKYLKKGDGVLVEGRQQTEKYTAKDGTTRYSTKCMAQSVTFLPKGSSTQQKTSNAGEEEHDFGDDFSEF
jgi:single-strand DNA-binding protein